MSSSEARILANQANALKSTGPRTEEGKARSRQNGLKHGMAGQGVVVPEAEQAELDDLNREFQDDLKPISAMGAALVRQLALLSIRMDRANLQELAANAANVRNARDDFDEARLDLAEGLLGGLADNPRVNLRKLMKMPEGVDLLIQTWKELRDDLSPVGGSLWTEAHLAKMGSLMGVREESAKHSMIGVVSRATWGDFADLSAQDGGNLDPKARREWARTRLMAGIEAEIAGLIAHYETLDFTIIEQDRAEAGGRALFDRSKEACLARRYESEASRRFFQALKEFHKVEAEVAAGPAAPPPPPPLPPRRSIETPPPLGSSRARGLAGSADPSPEWTRPKSAPVSGSNGVPGGSLGVDRGQPGPA